MIRIINSLQKYWLLFSISPLIAFIIVTIVKPSIMQGMAWAILIVNLFLAIIFSISKDVEEYQNRKKNLLPVIQRIIWNIFGIIFIVIISIFVASKVSEYCFQIIGERFNSASHNFLPISGVIAGILVGILVGFLVSFSIQSLLKRMSKYILK
jgi:hypothetical protein